MGKTNAELAAEVEELKKANADLAAQLEKKQELKQSALNQPRVNPDLTAEGYGEREYKYRAEPGVTMRLKKVADDPRGFTHKAKNNERFWEGTAKQFRDAFDVAGSEEAEAGPGEDEKK